MAKQDPDETPRTEWLVHGERSLYESRWVRLHLADVEAPNGERFEHHVVRMQRVAVAAVLDDDGEQLLMIRRHRFIDESWGWEVPVGIVERDESSATTAAREVEEETGWRPRELTRVLTYQPAIGIADTPHDVYAGTGADQVGAPTDVTEAEEVAWVPVARLPAMVGDDLIRDGATLVAVLHLLASRAT
ncbi:MAG TPA: NUDIX hydrolase [Nocardioidaceae bacterium]|nr:NUDIX hydrolase [Nocardioidaceae bacterium]